MQAADCVPRPMQDEPDRQRAPRVCRVDLSVRAVELVAFGQQGVDECGQQRKHRPLNFMP